MTTNNPKPPTEAELAAIKARCVAIGDPCVQSHPTSDAAALAIALFCATAAHDLPALLAAIEERDHLIWVMSQDQEAYRRGVEDGRRQYAEWAGGQIISWFGGAGWFNYHAKRDDAYRILTDLGVDPPPPLPPDCARAECERLRAALRAIAMLEPDDDSPAGVGMTLLVAQRIAREALGEDS